MKRLYLVIALLFSQIIMSQSYKKSEPFTHTYSIVARDSVTGNMGVAVQSHWFSVGSIVTYGKAVVGVVATQSLVNPSYGPKGLILMEQGLTPKQALTVLLANDSGEMYRQVAFLNSKGEMATHTGSSCIAEAGHRQGNNFSVQANMMLKNTVWDAMARAFEITNGTLSERMLAAMKAAENEKGDIRGRQSAAILIVKGVGTGNSWEDTLMDLRVEDHAHPLEELERLMKIHKAYDFMNQGDLAMEAGDSKNAEHLYLRAQNLFPENLEMQYWYAINLLNNKEFDKAKPILSAIFTKNENWRALIPRLVTSKLLKISESELEAVMKF
ncbi:Zn-dependent protease [Flavobacteriales bacterium 34_180_T64]|nr:Zn-dependent protease [Flavobacteriales bacterium 34_180_T64]